MKQDDSAGGEDGAANLWNFSNENTARPGSLLALTAGVSLLALLGVGLSTPAHGVRI